VKKFAFRAAAVLLALAVFVLGAELVANIYLYTRDGRYVAASERLDRLSNTFTTGLTKNEGCRYIDTVYPYPYLGFVHHGNPPCGVPDINNIGLFGPDFPSDRLSGACRARTRRADKRRTSRDELAA
jgi:hypothetical protein